MLKNNVPAVPDFWAQAAYKGLLKAAKNPRDAQERYLTSVRARDFQRVIGNVIMPLCRALGASDLERAYHEMFRVLGDVARQGDPHEFAEFPHDGGLQIIKDRLDGIEAQLRRLNQRLRYVEIDADGENIFIDFRSKEERRAA